MTPKKKSTAEVWTLAYEERPWTLNQERTWHHHRRAKIVKEWRQAFCDAAQEAMVPMMEKVEIVAQPYVHDGRYRQDVGNCFPAVKAAVDGIVDAGVLIDDNSNIVVKLTFLAPIMGRDALEIQISAVP